MSFLSTELKVGQKSSVLHGPGANGDAVHCKPPLGRREVSAPPTAPPGGAVVRRSEVCLSTFYAEADLDCSCDPEDRPSRWVSPLLRLFQIVPARLTGSAFRLQVRQNRELRRPEKGRDRRRELQPRVVAEPRRPGWETTAAPHADQKPRVGTASRQRGTPPIRRSNRWRRSSRRDRSESVGSEAVQEISGG